MSTCGITRVIRPFRSIRMKALGSKPADGASPLIDAAIPPGAEKPTSNPPPTASATCSSARREAESGPPSGSIAMKLRISSGRPSRVLDRLADAYIGAAATDVASHRGIDIVIVGVGRRRDQGGG